MPLIGSKKPQSEAKINAVIRNAYVMVQLPEHTPHLFRNKLYKFVTRKLIHHCNYGINLSLRHFGCIFNDMSPRYALN